MIKGRRGTFPTKVILRGIQENVWDAMKTALSTIIWDIILETLTELVSLCSEPKNDSVPQLYKTKCFAVKFVSSVHSDFSNIACRTIQIPPPPPPQPSPPPKKIVIAMFFPVTIVTGHQRLAVRIQTKWASRHDGGVSDKPSFHFARRSAWPVGKALLENVAIFTYRPQQCRCWREKESLLVL